MNNQEFGDRANELLRIKDEKIADVREQRDFYLNELEVLKESQKLNMSDLQAQVEKLEKKVVRAFGAGYSIGAEDRFQSDRRELFDRWEQTVERLEQAKTQEPIPDENPKTVIDQLVETGSWTNPETKTPNPKQMVKTLINKKYQPKQHLNQLPTKPPTLCNAQKRNGIWYGSDTEGARYTSKDGIVWKPSVS